MKRLGAELLKLKAKGESSLISEVEALMQVKASKKEIPLSHKFLALAAEEIDKGNCSYAHECIGAAIEAHQSKTPIELTAEFSSRLESIEVKSNDNAMMLPLPELEEDEPSFELALPEIATAFADILIGAGYGAQAKKYIESFNELNKEKESGMATVKSKIKSLLDLRAEFKKKGNFAMVKAADEMLTELKENGEGESQAAAWMDEAKGCGDDMIKGKLMQAGYMMKAAEEMEKEGHDAKAMKDDAEKLYKDAKASDEKPELEEKGAEGKEEEEEMKEEVPANTKPVLYVEAASQKEVSLRDAAIRAATKGDLKKAKAALIQAESMERTRLIAALIKAGDTDLAMEGLKEEEDSNSGMQSKANEEAAEKEAEEKKEGEGEAEGDDSEMPEGKLDPEAESKEREEPEDKPEEPKEEDKAAQLSQKVESSVKKGKLKDAVVAFTQLTKLEKAVVAGCKKIKKTDKALRKEGLQVWRAVAKARLHAEAVLAEHEKEDEVYDKAMEGMEMLEDESQAAQELDKALDNMDEADAEEITKEFLTPPGGAGEKAEPNDADPAEQAENKEEEEEVEKEMDEKKAEPGEKEADGMHYEVLQSIEEVKAMNVDRNSLAFTFWEDDSGKHPFYVVQAAGKPVAEIHLADQENASEIRAYFCDEGKYTKALAQSVENTSLYEMLKGIKARFYANAVDATAYATKMKQEAVASVSDVRTEKLAQLRRDYLDAMVVASEALNKGLYDRPNALKASFVKVLSSYGIVNPALAVEAAFKDAGSGFFEQVMDAATEYLDMPKEAFAHARKMVSHAQNVALAQASNYSSDVSIGQRLSQNSLPFASIPGVQEAPEVQASMQEWNERSRIDNYKRSLQLGRKIK